MISLLFFIASILTLSVYGAATNRIKQELSIPMSCMSIVVMLYVFGIFGVLKAGLYIAVGAVCVLYGYSIIRVIKNRSVVSFVSYFMNPIFYIAAFLFIILGICDYGKLGIQMDEMAHWLDSVKVMTIYDDFITNPASDSLYQSYPPGLALFQYFFQKITMWFDNMGGHFNEWRMYYAFHIMCVSMLLPIVGQIKKHKITFSIILFTIPVLFFPVVLRDIYVDPIIMIFTAVGFTVIMLHDEKKSEQRQYYIFISLLCFVVVIVKDVGLYFGIFISMLFTITELVEAKKRKSEGEKIICRLFIAVAPLMFCVFAKLTWYVELVTSNATIRMRGSNIDMMYYTKMFFFGQDATYRQEVVNKIKYAFFFIPPFNLRFLGIGVSYAALTILFIILGIALYKKFKKRRCTRIDRNSFTLLALLISVVFYAYSLGAAYCSNWTEYEALVLMSYNRYMNMPYGAAFIVLYVLIGYMLSSDKLSEYGGQNQAEKYTLGAIIIILIVALLPVETIYSFMRRDFVRESHEKRDPITYLSNLITNNCDARDKVWVIAQETVGQEELFVRFEVRPVVVSGNCTIGYPFYEGDVWTVEMDANEWESQLKEDGFKYVAILKLNDYFIEEFGQVFEDGEAIFENALYEFDSETRRLRFVDK